jgi:hypothetical protein
MSKATKVDVLDRALAVARRDKRIISILAGTLEKTNAAHGGGEIGILGRVNMAHCAGIIQP